MSEVFTNTHKDSTAERYSQIVPRKQIQERNRVIRDAELNTVFQLISHSKSVEQMAPLIKEYCVMIVGSNEEELFINHFVETKFLEVLQRRIKEFKSDSLLLRNTFSVFQFLLKALKKEENLVYFLVKLNQLGFVAQKYYFQDQEDIAYYANFLKLMVRKINQDPKYLAVFLNCKQPHFPLLLNLLKFYDCNDPIMHTSSKLAIMQISRNHSPLVQSFTLNFPFIIFYPLYIGQIQTNFKKAMQQDSNNQFLQNVENHLKYMQDFIADKERAVIDMYTNTFLKMMGKGIYLQLINITDKNKKKVIKLLKMLAHNIIADTSVVKIKICLMMMLSTSITTKMKKCYESKINNLQTNYWLLDECKAEVVSHCQSVFFNNEPTNRSFLKIFNSYIPRSKDNWLYYQIKKISELIGINIVLNQPISHDRYLNQSYLQALDCLIDDEYQNNQIHQAIIGSKDQELLYYYVKVLTQLIEYQQNFVVKYNLTPLIHQISICCSLGLVQAFYSLIEHKKLQDQSQAVMVKFQETTDKLVYFIMTKGWTEFIYKVKQSRLQQNEQKFNLDIYRQIQCDILLFVALRTLLSIPNSSGRKFDFSEWNHSTLISNKISYICRQYHQEGEQLIFTFNGQYFRIMDKQEQIITGEETLLSNFKFSQSESSIVNIIGSQSNSWGITLSIDANIRPYFLQEVATRKKIYNHISLELKSMFFQFSY